MSGAARGQVSDETLVSRARSGDEEAFAALLKRHGDALQRGVARRLPARLRRKVSVSDVVQEVRIVALQRIQDFEPRSPDAVRRWLDRIAQMKVRDLLKRYVRADKRRVGRELSRGARPDTAHFVAEGPSPSEAAMASETLALARAVLAELPEDYRTVLRFAREEQLSLREVAERMGRSREAIKKLYARAHARFTREFEERRRGS